MSAEYFKAFEQSAQQATAFGEHLQNCKNCEAISGRYCETGKSLLRVYDTAMSEARSRMQHQLTAKRVKTA